jgi:hypothetical protein
MIHPVTTEILSFRHLLTGAMREFLEAQSLGSEAFAEDVSELIVTLSGYREEGAALFPAVFFCDDLACLLDQLGGRDPVVVGAAPCSPLTMRRALKLCAPLGKGAWSVFIVRRAGAYEYGVFRSDDFVLSASALARLRALRDPALRLLGVVQLAENILEVRSSGGDGRLVHLSGARSDVMPATTFLLELVGAITRDVPAEVRPETGAFFRRVLIDALRSTHGSLIAVLPHGARDVSPFVDGLLLADPLDVAGRVARWRHERSTEARADVQGLAQLLAGMISADGITLLSSDGSIVGYNVFLHPGPGATDEEAALGGARQRTFRALAGEVGRTLVAAFVRSQDGYAECRIAAPGDRIGR